MQREPNKRIGDIYEAQFLVDSLRQGFTPSLPYGDNDQYDAIIENKSGKLIKIQVKGTMEAPIRNAHRVNTCRGYAKEQYTNVDFFAAYTPHATYIIPASVITTQVIKLSLNDNTKYSEYKNNWELLNLF